MRRTRTSLVLRGLVLVGSLAPAACAPPADRSFEVLSVPAPSLAGSVIANAAEQPALVFLPPGYEKSGVDYPTVYYLPGFTTSITEYVDGTFGGFHLGEICREAMMTGVVGDFVVVVVNGRNALGGSF